MNKTIILDTNVYGEILIERCSEEIIEKIRTNKAIIVYGTDVIKSELNKTPEHVKYKGILTRTSLLQIYNSIIDHGLTTSPLAEYLAREYFKEYKELFSTRRTKEKHNEENLKNDFKIVAIASLNSMDIIVSSDKRTLLSEVSSKIYNKVNTENNLRIPEMIEYQKFKEDYLK